MKQYLQQASHIWETDWWKMKTVTVVCSAMPADVQFDKGKMKTDYGRVAPAGDLERLFPPRSMLLLLNGEPTG